MARRSVEPSTMSLLGLVRHLAETERATFRVMMEVDFATRFVAAAASLDITGDDPLNQHGSGGGPMSLREALVGMIEEYARHMGHADLLRERIDGRLGQ
jgi:Protein of unknown function (DUF664)